MLLKGFQWHLGLTPRWSLKREVIIPNICNTNQSAKLISITECKTVQHFTHKYSLIKLGGFINRYQQVKCYTNWLHITYFSLDPKSNIHSRWWLFISFLTSQSINLIQQHNDSLVHRSSKSALMSSPRFWMFGYISIFISKQLTSSGITPGIKRTCN